MPKATMSEGYQALIDGIISNLKNSLKGKVKEVDKKSVIYIHTLEELGTVGVSIKIDERNEKPHPKKNVSRGTLYAHVKCIDPPGVYINGNGVMKVTKSRKSGDGIEIKPDTNALIEYVTDIIIIAHGVLELEKIKHVGHEESKYMIESHGQNYEGSYPNQRAKFYSVIPNDTLIPHVRVEFQFPSDQMPEFVAAMKLVKGNNIHG